MAKKNVINRDLSFVVFDGSTHYVVDRQDMIHLTSSDNDVNVVFKSFCIDICQSMADELNDLL